MLVDGKTTVLFDGFIRIHQSGIGVDKAKTVILTADGTDEDKAISLDDCLELIEYDGNGVVYVTFDTAMSGKIYQYGNVPDKCWYEYGQTMGFA